MIIFEAKLTQFRMNLKMPLSHTMTCHRNFISPRWTDRTQRHHFIRPFMTIVGNMTEEHIPGFQPETSRISSYVLRYLSTS